METSRINASRIKQGDRINDAGRTLDVIEVATSGNLVMVKCRDWAGTSVTKRYRWGVKVWVAR